MIKEKIYWATGTDAYFKNILSLTPDIDFMNTAGLKEYQKNEILDITNKNCVANYLNKGKKRFE